MMQHKILDAACGSRMFHFNKTNPDVFFCDNRKESHVLCDGRELHINPDEIMDFTQLKFADETFFLVIFDPPHLLDVGKNSWLYKKYGVLTPNWREIIGKGFAECFRVLKPNGTLIFKWSEPQIKTSDVLRLTKYKPLIGHKSGKKSTTHWVCFFKNDTEK